MRLRSLIVAGVVAAASMGFAAPAQADADASPLCPYSNPNACCGWIFVGEKGYKLFDCYL